jgi:hypothetical protein
MRGTNKVKHDLNICISWWPSVAGCSRVYSCGTVVFCRRDFDDLQLVRLEQRADGA